MMKKLILFCLALAVLVTSIPAIAATNVNFSGAVDIWHENLYNFNRSSSRDARWRDSDSFFTYRLTLNVEFQPSEDVSIFWRIRSLPFVRWGTVNAGSGGSPNGGADLYTSYLYAEIRQPWGTVQIGRVKGGLGSNAGGLQSLGYTPGWGDAGNLYVNPFDLNGPTDSIIYSYDFGNGFSIGAFYAKDDYNTLLPGWFAQGNVFPDQDKDRFGIEAKYVWDTGGFTLGVSYTRDLTGLSHPLVGNIPGGYLLMDGFTDAFGPEHPYLPSNNWLIHINPALVQSWGPFSIHFEADFAFGRTTYADACRSWIDNGLNVGPCIPGNKVSSVELGLGLYLDANYNYGAGDVTLMAWYIDGTPWDYDGDVSRHNVTMGDFAPFLVAFNGTWSGNGYYSNTIATDYPWSGQFGVGLLGKHAINDDISLNWGLGSFWLAKQAWPGQSKYLGFELDLGASFKLLENVSFETQFGYMWNGPAFRYTAIRNDIGNITGYTLRPRPEGTFAWANFITVSF
jgi:hypothetical protein